MLEQLCLLTGILHEAIPRSQVLDPLQEITLMTRHLLVISKRPRQPVELKIGL